MNQDYIKADHWSIIEEGFDVNQVKSSESLFSIGNGAMGQRANFEETYSGPTFQGNYIAGVYYPDKTRVGWWKNGYPEYFAKVLNAPNWIGIHVTINEEVLDLFKCKKVENFRRELNMKEGWLSRSFKATLQNSIQIQVDSKRFLSLDFDEVGAIQYQITPLNNDAQINFSPYLDNGITNEDSNWDDKFWDVLSVDHQDHQAFIVSRTMKTHFNVCTAMQSHVSLNGDVLNQDKTVFDTSSFVEFQYQNHVNKGDTITLTKFGGYITDRNHDKNELISVAKETLNKVSDLGFHALLELQKTAWSKIWDRADITISGDVKAQQGIRFNIFQLNQTYLGTDARLNIGPKGFTGEKYGGSTYWDTEAYCIPFYLATKNQQV
ncbi:MAG: glycoside hydrolase family 65 protein, partial [Flavobacteriales bacterium]|nr:glycoside hydrolase family 65 protein [Flavobacteriales bacterium]